MQGLRLSARSVVHDASRLRPFIHGHHYSFHGGPDSIILTVDMHDALRTDGNRDMRPL